MLPQMGTPGFVDGCSRLQDAYHMHDTLARTRGRAADGTQVLEVVLSDTQDERHQ